MATLNRGTRWLLLVAAALGLVLGLGVRVSFEWYRETAAGTQPAADVEDVERLRARLSSLEDFSTPVQAVADLLLPSVVSISAGTRGGSGFLVSSAGSGFLFDRRGYIVTNNHVVREQETPWGMRRPRQFRVELWNGDAHDAELVGVDEPSDLAVIKIDAEGLRPVALGESDALRVGQAVVAIGNQFGHLSGSVTLGIVSALGRSDLAVERSLKYLNFIQTDAAINQGNSGGPLVNLKGEVVGVSTAIQSPLGVNVGIGFAIPSSTVRFVIPQLIEKGKVTRGWLGIQGRDVARLSARLRTLYGIRVDRGVIVDSVAFEGPAEQAGIQAGDVLVGIGADPLEGMARLQRLIAEKSPGSAVELLLDRRGRERRVEVRLEEFPRNTDDLRWRRIEVR